MLTAATFAYLASLPFGWLSYRAYEQRSRETKAEPAHAPAVPPAAMGATMVRPAENEDRPSRLN